MFSPGRLSLARRRRGLTQTELARRSRLPPRRISDYERARREPDDAALRTIASALGFPTRFFARTEPERIPDEALSFRAGRKIAATKRAAAVGAAMLAAEFNDWLEGHFTLPDVAVPALEGVDPETAAEMVRARWGLGQKAIPNTVHLLESQGARVFALGPDHAEVDAFSLWHGSCPFVFLNTRTSAERGRFDAAHELGHLVLHAGAAAVSGRESEEEAHAFASALLMPSTSVLARMPREALSSQIIESTEQWGVSALALARRLHELGLLSKQHYRTACIELSRRGYRQAEPTGVTRENSQLLNKVLRSLRQRRIGVADIADELAVSSDDLAALMVGLAVTAVPGDGPDPPSGHAAPTTPPQLSLVAPG